MDNIPSFVLDLIFNFQALLSAALLMVCSLCLAAMTYDLLPSERCGGEALWQEHWQLDDELTHVWESSRCKYSNATPNTAWKLTRLQVVLLSSSMGNKNLHEKSFAVYYLLYISAYVL